MAASSEVVFRQIIACPRYVVCNVQSRSVFVVEGWVSHPVAGGGPSYVVSVSLDSLIVWGYFVN